MVLRFSPPHKSPTPGTARRAAMLAVFDDAYHGFASLGLRTKGELANG